MSRVGHPDAAGTAMVGLLTTPPRDLAETAEAWALFWMPVSERAWTGWGPQRHEEFMRAVACSHDGNEKDAAGLDVDRVDDAEQCTPAGSWAL